MVDAPCLEECSVLWDANSGPPSEVSVSGMPKVENVSRSALMSPNAPSLDGKTMGQLLPRVRTEVQEGVLRLHWGGRWHGGLSAVADGAPIACGGDVPCDA